MSEERRSSVNRRTIKGTVNDRFENKQEFVGPKQERPRLRQMDGGVPYDRRSPRTRGPGPATAIKTVKPQSVRKAQGLLSKAGKWGKLGALALGAGFIGYQAFKD